MWEEKRNRGQKVSGWLKRKCKGVSFPAHLKFTLADFPLPGLPLPLPPGTKAHDTGHLCGCTMVQGSWGHQNGDFVSCLLIRRVSPLGDPVL